MSHDLPLDSASALIEGYGRKDFTPLEVMEEVLRRAEDVQRRLNPFVTILPDLALRDAEAATSRWSKGVPVGLLDGVPVAVKDTLPVYGWPTGYGSAAGGQPAPATEDAPLSASLRCHGAVFFAKTAAPEFGWKGLTESRAQGATGNPFDPGRTAGGSSGGSAVAVQQCVCPIATGADGGGSLRIPAAFTDIYGLKPTANLVPSLPSPLGTMAEVGGLTRTAADQALFLDAACRPDARDTSAIPPRGISYRSALPGHLKGLRIGVATDFGLAVPDPEIVRRTEIAALALKDLGCEVKEIQIRAAHLRTAFETLWAMAFAEILSRLKSADLTHVEPELLHLSHEAGRKSGSEVHEAGRACRQFSAQLGKIFQDIDLLLTPSVAVLPFRNGRLTPDPERFPAWWDWTPFTWPFNLSRNPAASVPAGFSSQGLPIGVQLVGRWYDEATILKVSAPLQAALAA